MLAIAPQCHAGGVDGLAGGDRVAFDARHLHEPGDRIAGQAEVVLHGDLGGVLHLLGRPAHDCGQSPGRHRGGGSDLTLTAHLGAGDRRPLLVEDSDGCRGEQEVDDGSMLRGLAAFLDCGDVVERIVQHGGDDAGRPIRRRGDDAASRGVLLVHGHRDEVDPFEVVAGIPVGVLGLEFEVPVVCAAADLEPSGQITGAVQGRRSAFLHHRVDVEQSVPDLVLVAHRQFVGVHDLGDGQIVLAAALKQLDSGVEGIGQLFVIGLELGVDDGVRDSELGIAVSRVRLGGLLLVEELGLRGHEPAADGVVGLLGEGLPGSVIGGHGHSVRMAWEDGQRSFDHVILGELEFDAVAGRVAEDDRPGLGHPCPPGGQFVGFDEIGATAFEADEDGVEGPMAGTGGGQGTEHVDAQIRHGAQRIAKEVDEARAGTHRSDGVGARRSDADREEVEDTQWHGNHFVSDEMTTGPTEQPCTHVQGESMPTLRRHRPRPTPLQGLLPPLGGAVLAKNNPQEQSLAGRRETQLSLTANLRGSSLRRSRRRP